MPTISVTHLGRTRYADAWDLQRRILKARQAGTVGDILLLTEHEHVYTLGTSGNHNHLLATLDELHARGVDYVPIDRGGDITYHGPGQIVGYPILDLTNYRQDLHWYLRNLEEVLIRTLGHLNVKGEREEGMTGVWVRGEKVAAIGVRVSRWVTMHGFALNVNTDLSMFNRIIPCGIFHKGVTSLEKILGRTVSMDEVMAIVAAEFGSVFNATVGSMELIRIAGALKPAHGAESTEEVQSGPELRG